MSTLKEICKEQTEMIDEMRQNIRELTKESDQYKAEREKFEQMLNEECERGYQMEGKYRDMKTQRDTLIDDIAVLKANISRLERQNAEQLALLKQFRKLIDYKLTLHQGSSMYREYRSKLDQLGVK